VKSLLISVLVLGSICGALINAASAQTLVERLGYPAGTKLIIIHADDLGETHAVNAAVMQAFERGAVNSASMMVPCPWFPEVARWAKAHP
jgi:hypothetical protein